MALVLVTGGAGFIGSHIVEALLRRGDRVRVLDNFSTGTLDNLGQSAHRVEILTGDLRDERLVARAVAGAGAVIHLAAMSGVQYSVQQPLVTHEVNATASLNLFVAARDAGIYRLVLASSASVYGDPAQVPTPETAPLAPLSPYGASKVAMEQYGAACSAVYGLSVISLRYFNVYGPRQPRGGAYAAVVPAFLERIHRGDPPLIFGDGLQSRDFVHVDDVAAATLAALDAPLDVTGPFNIGSGRALTMLGLAARLGSPSPPRFRPAKAGDIRHSQADVSRAKNLLGWQPLTAMLQ